VRSGDHESAFSCHPCCSHRHTRQAVKVAIDELLCVSFITVTSAARPAVQDRALCNHVLQVHKTGQAPPREESDRPLPADTLRAYIARAKGFNPYIPVDLTGYHCMHASWTPKSLCLARCRAHSTVCRTHPFPKLRCLYLLQSTSSYLYKPTGCLSGLCWVVADYVDAVYAEYLGRCACVQST
jgi:hypothetical protein